MRNTGATNNANNVQLTDPLPANTTFVSVNAGADNTCTSLAVGASSGTITCNLGAIPTGAGNTETVTLVVRPTAAAGTAGNVSNTATADGSNTDPATVTEFTQVTPSGITMTKDDDPDPADVGESLLYTLKIKNNTGSAVNNLVVTDKLPNEVDFISVDPESKCEESNNVVTCEDIDLAASGTTGDTTEIKIFVEPQEVGTIKNTAQAFSSSDLFTPIAEAKERPLWRTTATTITTATTTITTTTITTTMITA